MVFGRVQVAYNLLVIKRLYGAIDNRHSYISRLDAMRRAFRWATALAVIAVVVGLGLLAYGRFNTSAAAEFDESIIMVNHQTTQMSTSLAEAGSFVDSDISRITEFSTLLATWSPRFKTARTAYNKFDAAIVSAETRAEEYFANQRALTQRYHDPELRRAAESNDEIDYDLYSEWRNQAHRVREEALAIIRRLEDMDTDLQKLKLASEFSFDSNALQEVPVDILALEDELAHFKTASENIRAITSSPFEVNQ